jgi:hypothetical protein
MSNECARRLRNVATAFGCAPLPRWREFQVGPRTFSSANAGVQPDRRCHQIVEARPLELCRQRRASEVRGGRL